MLGENAVTLCSYFEVRNPIVLSHNYYVVSYLNVYSAFYRQFSWNLNPEVLQNEQPYISAYVTYSMLERAGVDSDFLQLLDMLRMIASLYRFP
jgi:hypothetical protein